MHTGFCFCFVLFVVGFVLFHFQSRLLVEIKVHESVMVSFWSHFQGCFPGTDIIFTIVVHSWHGRLARYVKLWVAHAPGMPGTLFPRPTSKGNVRDARAMMHVGIAKLRWRGKRSRHSRRMRNPLFYVYGKRPMTYYIISSRWLLQYNVFP